MKVLVTGADGFIGSHLVRTLALEGHDPRASRVRLPDAGNALDRELAGCDAVVHAAARVHVLREGHADPLAAFRSVNVEGTRSVLAAAARARVPHVVFLSTVAAEFDPVSPYGRSKLEAERVLLDAAAGGSPIVTVLRPPLVYGEGMKGNPLRLFRHLWRRLPVPLVDRSAERSVVYAGNLALAVIAALAARPAGVFNVADGAAVPVVDFIRAAGAALGRPARVVPLAPSLLRGLAAMGDAAGRWLPVPFDSRTLERLAGTLVVDSAPLREATGFEPRYTLAHGLQMTADWFRPMVSGSKGSTTDPSRQRAHGTQE